MKDVGMVMKVAKLLLPKSCFIPPLKAKESIYYKNDFDFEP